MPANMLTDHSGISIKPGNAALRKGRVSLPNHAYIVTAATCDRKPVFANFHAACVAARCFGQRELTGDAALLAWVLMPDHAHWLIQLGDSGNLSSVVSRLKSASARAANRALERNGALWEAAFHDRALRREEDMRTAARYLIANPVRAGLVEKAADYPFWDAVWIG